MATGDACATHRLARRACASRRRKVPCECYWQHVRGRILRPCSPLTVALLRSHSRARSPRRVRGTACLFVYVACCRCLVVALSLPCRCRRRGCNKYPADVRCCADSSGPAPTPTPAPPTGCTSGCSCSYMGNTGVCKTDLSCQGMQISVLNGATGCEKTPVCVYVC